MANISKRSADSIFSIKRFLGMNESVDGEADLPLGMAKTMRNFRVTREGNLNIRPGYMQMHKLGSGPVRFMWSGYVSGVHVFLTVCDGVLWRIDEENAINCGSLKDGHTFIFGFGGYAYILAGGEYYKWDGAEISIVEGYAPLIAAASPPAGGGTTLEPVNKLTGKRRQRFSPDGTATTFQLAEKSVSVISVERNDGGELPAWETNGAAGTVIFASAPPVGTDCITVTYDAGVTDRSAVENMKYAEIYGGTTDSRVFLYGDGSNRTIYSDVDGDGTPSAEYFPDLNVINAGEANTPITGMIRHFSRLVVFKIDGAFTIATSTVTLSDGSATAAFYINPTQRNIGNDAPGQVRLVGNNPRTVSARAIYEWKSNSGTLSDDERTVKRLSENIEATLYGWDTAGSICFDDDMRAEWYMVKSGRAVVHNYDSDCWYAYSNFPAICMERHGEELYFGTEYGEIMHLSESYRSDNGAPIETYWESGAMSFGRDWQLKYSADMWVVLKPEAKSKVSITVLSDRKSNYIKREISANSGTSFVSMDFSNFSFNANRTPRVRRVRIKVKKFAYYSLVFSTNSDDQTVTILGVDIKVRYTGNVKQR